MQSSKDMVANKGKILTKDLYTNVALNYGFRIIGIFLNLLLVRISIDYLGNTVYGIWATIASIASWVNYSDFGIGNGLRNKLASAVAENDITKQKKLIVTSAVDLSIIALILLVILTVLSEFLVRIQIFDSSIRLPLLITNFFLSLDLLLGVGRAIAYGYQKSWMTSFGQTGTVAFRVIGVLLLYVIAAEEKNILLYSIASGLGCIFADLLLLLLLKRKIFNDFSFSVKSDYDTTLNKSIVGLGLSFFVIQMACLILYSSDNLIINTFLTSNDVTKYEVITRIFTTGENLFSIVLVSLWSAVTYAYTTRNFKWIEKKLKEMIMIWLVFSIGVITVALCFNWIVDIWIGRNAMHYEQSLIFLFATYTILSTFGSIFVNISNGMGRLKIQFIFAVVAAIVNIPLSIYFAKTLNMGIFGVKLATLICCVGSIVFVPLDIVCTLHKVRKNNE